MKTERVWLLHAEVGRVKSEQPTLTPERLLIAVLMFAAIKASGSDYRGTRRMPDGRVLYLEELFEARLQLGVSVDDRSQQYEQTYIYECSCCAYAALWNWNGVGEPQGWVRRVEGSQLPRRRFGGDPRRETVRE